MLNILEKIQFGLSFFVILGSMGLYVWQGMDPRPSEFLESVRKVNLPKRPELPKKTGAAPAPPPAVSAADRDLLQRLAKEQNVSVAGKEVQHEEYSVPKDTFEYLKRKANHVSELNKAGHELLPGADGRPTRLKVTNIDPDSLLKKFGFENNDVIELIDGERIDYEKSSELDHYRRWERILEKLEKGGMPQFTVTRGGQILQVGFRL